MDKDHPSETAGQDSLDSYYRLHSKIYDATRWSFLFGRGALVQRIAAEAQPKRILEVGCGTGTNLIRLAQVFPRAELHGLDLSEHMLARARKKLTRHGENTRLLRRAYERSLSSEEPFDLILFSYSLSMFNPGWDRALDAARRDLASGGLVAAVDFHDTPLELFSKWMELNHVRLGGHLLAALRQKFTSRFEQVDIAWLGLWRYFLFIGRNQPI